MRRTHHMRSRPIARRNGAIDLAPPRFASARAQLSRTSGDRSPNESMSQPSTSAVEPASESARRRAAVARTFAYVGTLALIGIAMGAVFLFHQMAGQVPPVLNSRPSGANTWAMLMAWGPIFIFGPISVFLLDRVKT